MDTKALKKRFLGEEAYLPRICMLLPEMNYPEKVNLTEELLDRNLPHYAEKIAIYWDTKRISYRELHSEVNRFANALRKLGICPNDRVVLRSMNIPEQIVWNFACWRIGAIPVLVNHLNRRFEIEFKINDSEAVAICVDSSSYEEVGLVAPRCPTLKQIIVHGDRIRGTLHYHDLILDQSEVSVSTPRAREDFARIVYSSGTTGKPKGIVTTTEGVLSLSDTHGRHILRLKPDDVVGGHPYFSFAFGAANFLLMPWRFGAAVSIITKFSAEGQLDLIHQHGITILCAVPTALRMMLGVENAEHRHSVSKLRMVLTAGEPLPANTAKEWRARFGQDVINSLGSGELHYWISTFEGMPSEKFGSTGLQVPGYECLVVDENLEPVPNCTEGELIVRGPLGQLYWRRPDAQRNGVCPPDSKYPGWSRPGLCFMQDSDGYFWYKARLDDMIVTSGYKVPGGEVEEALNSHQAVMESVVVGVPDEERGNVIVAFVVTKPHVNGDNRLAIELQEFVKQKIEPYKYPRHIRFVASESFPRTVTGKIQLNVLREREVQRLLDAKAQSESIVG